MINGVNVIVIIRGSIQRSRPRMRVSEYPRPSGIDITRDIAALAVLENIFGINRLDILLSSGRREAVNDETLK